MKIEIYQELLIKYKLKNCKKNKIMIVYYFVKRTAIHARFAMVKKMLVTLGI